MYVSGNESQDNVSAAIQYLGELLFCAGSFAHEVSLLRRAMTSQILTRVLEVALYYDHTYERILMMARVDVST